MRKQAFIVAALSAVTFYVSAGSESVSQECTSSLSVDQIIALFQNDDPECVHCPGKVPSIARQERIPGHDSYLWTEVNATIRPKYFSQLMIQRGAEPGSATIVNQMLTKSDVLPNGEPAIKTLEKATGNRLEHSAGALRNSRLELSLTQKAAQTQVFIRLSASAIFAAPAMLRPKLRESAESYCAMLQAASAPQFAARSKPRNTL